MKSQPNSSSTQDTRRPRRGGFRVAPLVSAGVAIVGSTVLLVVPAGSPSALATSPTPAPVVQTRDVQLTAAGDVIGKIVGLFVGNGTDAAANCTGAACNGGRAGILIGDGGSGANGGAGGRAGLLFGNGGNGGNGNYVIAGFGLSVNGGKGGSGG